MRIAQEIYRTMNDADLQGVLVSKADESNKAGIVVGGGSGETYGVIEFFHLVVMLHVKNA